MIHRLPHFHQPPRRSDFLPLRPFWWQHSPDPNRHARSVAVPQTPHFVKSQIQLTDLNHWAGVLASDQLPGQTSAGKKMYPPGKEKTWEPPNRPGTWGNSDRLKRCVRNSQVVLLHQNIMVLQIPVILKPCGEKSPLGAYDYLV